MIKIISLLILSLLCSNLFAQDFSCTKYSTFTLAYLVKEGNTPSQAQALYDAKCKIAKPASKKEMKKVYDCSSCVAEIQAQTGQFKGYLQFEDKCKVAGKCIVSLISETSWFLSDLQHASSQILPCEDQMFCSDDTKMCEYVCDSGFVYMPNSGMCEKNCGFDEISIGDQCTKCGENEIVNVDANRCDCSSGTVRDNGSGLCVPNCSSTEIYEFPNGCFACEQNQISHENQCVNPDLLCPIEGTIVSNHISSWFGPDTYDCDCSNQNQEIVGNKCQNKCENGQELNPLTNLCEQISSCENPLFIQKPNGECVSSDNYCESEYNPYDMTKPYESGQPLWKNCQRILNFVKSYYEDSNMFLGNQLVQVGYDTEAPRKLYCGFGSFVGEFSFPTEFDPRVGPSIFTMLEPKCWTKNFFNQCYLSGKFDLNCMKNYYLPEGRNGIKLRNLE